MDWDNFGTFKFVRKNTKGDRFIKIIARVFPSGGNGEHPMSSMPPS